MVLIIPSKDKGINIVVNHTSRKWYLFTKLSNKVHKSYSAVVVAERFECARAGIGHLTHDEIHTFDKKN